jgi:hypothetical protein
MAIMSLILIIPILIAAVVLILNKREFIPSSLMPGSKITFLHLVLTFFLVFVVSIILLISSQERSLAYFISIAAAAGILSLQIVSGRSQRVDYIIVFEIVLLSLNLIWGAALKYPFYVSATDSMVHLSFVDTILNTGQFSGIGETYRYFPAYHVFIAMGAEITGMSLIVVNFLLVGIAWQAGTIFAYLIFKKLSSSSWISLLGCLMFAMAEVTLFYGSYAVARSLAYVFLMGWVYLSVVLSGKDAIKYVPLLLIIMTVMILTHHVTLILLIFIMGVVFVCQKIFSGFRGGENIPQTTSLMLLGVCFIFYLVWVASDLFNPIFREFVSSFLVTETTIVMNERIIAGGPLAFIFNSLYYSLVLIFSIIGIGIAWNAARVKNRRNTLRSMALAALLFLVLYLPYPLGLLPQADLAFAQRFPPLVLPFIAFIMAYGIGCLAYFEIVYWKKLMRGKALPVLSAVLVSITVFFSAITGGNAQDTSYFPHTYTIATTHFRNYELDSFSFLNQNGNSELASHSDYYTTRNIYYLDNITTRNVLIGGNIDYIKQGYIVLRVSELIKRGGLMFSPDGSILKCYTYRRDPSKPEEDIMYSLSSKNKIYNNGNVIICLIQ